MQNTRVWWTTALVVAVAGWLTTSAVDAQLPGALPGVEPLHDSGQDVTPAFEGWFKNPDGSFEIVLGYNNRNLKQVVDIPIGPNNRFEGVAADQGQPTHFLPRRGWGVFTVNVPKDFGSRKITWTLAANGRTNTIPFSLDPRWEIDAIKEATVGNTPPVLSFKPNAPGAQGPKHLYTTMTAAVGTPLTLDIWGKDDNKNKSRNYRGEPFSITWSMYRGPADVKFAKAKPEINKDTGQATTTVEFSQPGEYWLKAQGNDSSGEGGGGFQCCWTNAIAKVTVK